MSMGVISVATGPANQAWAEGTDQRFEAAVIDWDRTATAGWRLGGAALVEELCSYGFDLAVVTNLSLDDVLTEIGARPTGPGRLLLGIARERAIFRAGAERLDRVVSGLHDRLAVVRWVLDDLWSRGIDPNQVLLLAGLAIDADSGLGAPVAAARTDVARRLLDDQVRRRRRGDVPIVPSADDWCIAIDGLDHSLERFHESLLTLADGQVGTRGAPLVGDGATRPGVYHVGVYEGRGSASELAALPLWSRLPNTESLRPSRRTLHLRTGVLHEQGPLASLRFSSLARPGTVALRVNGDDALLPQAGTRSEGGAVSAAFHDVRRTGVLDRFAAYARDKAAAVTASRGAAEAGFEHLLGEHREAWARRWQAADIVIEGDPDLQRAIRFSLFHLMASVGDRDEAAVGARGLSGPAYRGHVFWDSDVFVLPFLAATHPAAARAMLEYRVRRLPAARAAAARLGRAGARFPWESAAEGIDVTPTSVRSPSGELVPIRTGELEEHIVADVAWSAACYLDWAGDTGFGAGPGRDLLVETARYWASRVRVGGDGRAHIEAVIGPDEYHERVDDNAFTNVMARWNLRRAAELAAVSRSEREAWRAVADALVDGYDPATQVYEQFAGFRELEPVLISEIAPRRPIAADLLLGAERVARAQVIKQADVLMLHHLVPDEVVADSLPANLDFYEPRTAHGSSLSPAIHAALLARLRRYGPALEWLRVAARIDLGDLTGSTAGGLHLATMGGLWQAIVHGFAGVRVLPDRLLIDPRLPSEWTSLSIGLRYRGTPFRLHIGRDSVAIDTQALPLRKVDSGWEVAAR
jgi:trehalose/maltose hydrolase-like predicted phosphorylase